MGGISVLLMLPLLLLYSALKYFGPVLGFVGVFVAILGVLLFVLAQRVLARSRRRWVRVIGDILIGLAIALTLVATGAAVVTFAATGYVNSFG